MEAKKGNFMPFDVSEQLFLCTGERKKAAAEGAQKKAMSVNEVKN